MKNWKHLFQEASIINISHCEVHSYLSMIAIYQLEITKDWILIKVQDIFSEKRTKINPESSNQKFEIIQYQ